MISHKCILHAHLARGSKIIKAKNLLFRDTMRRETSIKNIEIFLNLCYYDMLLSMKIKHKKVTSKAYMKAVMQRTGESKNYITYHGDNFFFQCVHDNMF